MRLYLASLDGTLTSTANVPARTTQEPPDTLPMLNLETRFGAGTPLATALCRSAFQLSSVFAIVVARCNDPHRRPFYLTIGTALWGNPPVRGDTAPGMSRGRVVTSHVTPP